MVEQTPIPQPEERFGNIYDSPYLQHGNAIAVPGDPETPEDFARTQAYLESITAHLIEFGPVWEKQPQEVAQELDWHNAWHKYEIELEKKSGEERAEYREINLHNLKALSTRRRLAFEETGWEVTHDYKVITHIDHLIGTAVLEQEQFEELMAPSAPVTTPLGEDPSDVAQDVPF